MRIDWQGIRLAVNRILCQSRNTHVGPFIRACYEDTVEHSPEGLRRKTYQYVLRMENRSS